MSESTERPTIELSSDLDTRLDRRRRETGFDSTDAYVRFVLEQVLRATETGESERDQFDAGCSDDVRGTLKELGYL